MNKKSKTFSIFATRDYRHALREVVEAKRAINRCMNFQILAEAARIPKSYLSKVLAGTANLSTDQAYIIGGELSLNRTELEYFLLLVDRDRCGVVGRQKDLDKKIEMMQEKYLETESHLVSKPPVSLEDMAPYYMSPWAQVIHMALLIPRFAKQPQLLQQSLALSHTEFQKTLRVLESLGILTTTSLGYHVNSIHMHLPKDSPLFRNWKMQQDMLSLATQLDERDPKAYGFRVTIASTEDTRAEIRRRFLEFLKGVEEICITGEAEHVYQMRFDLFSWV
jgi:uncharacterized protein (TIGR02147 family)